MKNYYEILGVKKQSLCIWIRIFFRREAMQLHPGKDKMTTTGKMVQFINLCEAFYILTHGMGRSKYNRIYSCIFLGEHVGLSSEEIEFFYKVYIKRARKIGQEYYEMSYQDFRNKTAVLPAELYINDDFYWFIHRILFD